MTQDENQRFSQYIETYGRHFALFFTDQGILVNQQTKTPFLPLEQTRAVLEIDLNSAHLDKDTVIIKCQIGLSAIQLRLLNLEIINVKVFLAQADPKLQATILRAHHWLNWDNQSNFCGKCGVALVSQFELTEKHCQDCGAVFFPRFSPAIMVLIHRADHILLARSPNFRPGVYSAIAGFIDIGESAEQAVHREVKEELGIEVTDLTYFGTQPWPFPDSFMIAFQAKYRQGELRIDPNEIEDAQWFSRYNLPALPPHASISRQLIDSIILHW